MSLVVRATEDAVVRLLKAGHPLPSTIVHREAEVRLPVFQAIEPVSVKDYGMEGTARVVVARARKEVWLVDIKRRSGPITSDDAKTFLTVLDSVRERHKNQEVTGWMVTTGDLDAEAVALLNGANCLYTARAAKR